MIWWQTSGSKNLKSRIVPVFIFFFDITRFLLLFVHYTLIGTKQFVYFCLVTTSSSVKSWESQEQVVSLQKSLSELLNQHKVCKKILNSNLSANSVITFSSTSLPFVHGDCCQDDPTKGPKGIHIC